MKSNKPYYNTYVSDTLNQTKDSITALNTELETQNKYLETIETKLNEINQKKIEIIQQNTNLEIENNRLFKENEEKLIKRNNYNQELKELENELTKNESEWQIKKRNYESELINLKGKQENITIMKEKEGQAYENMKKQMISNIGESKKRKEFCEQEIKKYESFIHSVQEKNEKSLNEILLQTATFKNFIDENK